MERHSNLSFFLIISLAFHLSLVLLFRGLLLKPAISSDGSLAEVELLQVPTSAIIGKFPTKLQQFSGGKEKGGLSNKGKTSMEAPLASRRPAPSSELMVPIGKSPKAVKPSPPHPTARAAPSPDQVPVPTPPASGPATDESSQSVVASIPGPPAATAPVTPDRDAVPPLPKPLPLMRDQKRELAKEESPLDFPRMQIPFINEKDLEKMARAVPKTELPQRDKGMTLDLDEFKFGPYGRSIVEKVERVWEYPRDAIRKGMQGTLVLTFLINKDGSIKDLKVSNSSGFSPLDEEAMRAVKAAAPFKPLPGNIGIDEFPVRFTFIYTILGRGVYVH